MRRGGGKLDLSVVARPYAQAVRASAEAAAGGFGVYTAAEVARVDGSPQWSAEAGLRYTW